MWPLHLFPCAIFLKKRDVIFHSSFFLVEFLGLSLITVTSKIIQKDPSKNKPEGEIKQQKKS